MSTERKDLMERRRVGAGEEVEEVEIWTQSLLKLVF